MTRLLFSFLLVAAFAACSKNEEKVEKRSIEYFSLHLKADMDINAITKEWGDPDDDIGSGIHIYVYELKDNTEIWIGYTDHIMYARQVDGNRQILRTLI